MAVLGPLPQNKVLRREFERGRHDGELRILRSLLIKRFGELPNWADEKLASRATAELEDLAVRLPVVTDLEDLLK